MKKELDEALVKDFPNLYKNRNGNMKETAMMWGFECGSGWEPLIRKLSEGLEAEILKLPEADREYHCASQVKEKYGTLRYYMHGETDEMSKLINIAENESEITCETCGKEGKLDNKTGWLYTACEEHTK